MARFQILYWQTIPSQVKAWDDFDEVKLEMPLRFTERTDAAAQAQGLTGADAYMSQLRWSDEEERPGEAAAVANAVKAELEAKFP